MKLSGIVFFNVQVILGNTRGRADNFPSLLDLVLCYENSLIKDIEYQSSLGKSDHCIIKFSYDIKCISNAYTCGEEIFL